MQTGAALTLMLPLVAPSLGALGSLLSHKNFLHAEPGNFVILSEVGGPASSSLIHVSDAEAAAQRWDPVGELRTHIR